MRYGLNGGMKISMNTRDNRSDNAILFFLNLYHNWNIFVEDAKNFAVDNIRVI
jgi:hypothetical protein